MKQTLFIFFTFILFCNIPLAADQKKGTPNAHPSSDTSLLQDAFGAVAISTENIEALYVEAIENTLHEKSYGQIGAPWESEEYGDINSLMAGLNIIQEPKIVFSLESFDFNTEIAFEQVPKRDNKFKLSSTDVSEINEALIFSEIKAKYIDPKEFDVTE